jgi:hypothetical protein
MTTTTLPSAPDAEQSILATIMIDPSVISEMGELSPEDFYDGKHQKIWSAVCAQMAEDMPVDAASITERLRLMGFENGIGSYLGKLMDYPASASVDHHMGLIRATAAKRRAILEVGRLYHEIKDEPDIEVFGRKTAEAYEIIRSTLDQSGTKTPLGRLSFIHFADLLAQPHPVEWLVKDYLTQNCLALLFAKAGMVKSFLALSLGMSIATGKEWFGRSIKKTGPVFYVAGEGFSGLPSRLKAYCIEYGVKAESAPFFLSNQSIQVLDPDSLQQAIKTIDNMIRQHGKPELIILDTLARTFGPGDENSTADMSAFVSAVDRMRFRFNSAVLIIHHSGLTDGDRSRGSSALRAALDFEYKIEAEGDTRIRRLTCTKAKDCEEPPDIYFESKCVQLGWIDPDDGEEISSIVLKQTEPPAASRSKIRLSGARRIALETLQGCSQIQCGPVHLDVWRDAAYSAGITASTDSSARRKAFQRAVSSLMDSKLVTCEAGYYVPTT